MRRGRRPHPQIAVRDSKDPVGPHVTFSATAWADFVTYATK
ncbi:DUF397 domain-containing protein [Streptomyces sp. NPDC047082]